VRQAPLITSIDYPSRAPAAAIEAPASTIVDAGKEERRTTKAPKSKTPRAKAAPGSQMDADGTLDDLHEREEIVERGKQAFIGVGQALQEIRERRLYKLNGYPTFDQYLIERWGFTRQRASQYIGAWTVVEGLSGVIDKPGNEAQTRELRKILSWGANADVEAVWREVIEIGGDNATAKLVKEVALRRKHNREAFLLRNLAKQVRVTERTETYLIFDDRLKFDLKPNGDAEGFGSVFGVYELEGPAGTGIKEGLFGHEIVRTTQPEWRPVGYIVKEGAHSAVLKLMTDIEEMNVHV